MVELTEYRLQIALDVIEQMLYQEAPNGCHEEEYASTLQSARELISDRLNIVIESEDDE